MNENVKPTNTQTKADDRPVRYYIPAIEKMRLILMGLAILYTFGSYSPIAEINGAVLGFVFPALFIISGYLVIWEGPATDKRILKAIGKTAICFVVLTGVFILLSLWADKAKTLELLTSRWFWMDFLVLNKCALPIGSTIWYVQSLLYAYIIVYVIYKLKLIRLDLLIAILCLAFAVVSGELAKVVNFCFKGHDYLGGNFLTRALPYILIGSFLHRKRKYFGSKPVSLHFVIGFLGFLAAAAEYVALRMTGKNYYVGHLFGMAFVAMAVCAFCFYVDGMELFNENFLYLTRFELMLPYIISSPVNYLLVRFFEKQTAPSILMASRFKGIIILVITFALLFIYAAIRAAIGKKHEGSLSDGIKYEYLDNAYDKDFVYVDEEAEEEGYHTEYMDNAYDKDFVYVDPDLEEEEDEDE